MGTRLVSIGAVLAVASAMACANDGPEKSTEAPGYKQLYEKIFSQRCTQCHTGARGMAGLSFDDRRVSYNQLIDVYPTNSAAVGDGLLRVVPGQPELSLLYLKLTMSPHDLEHREYGAAMPLAGVEKIGPNSRQAIRDWILAGAPENGLDFEADWEPRTDDVYVACDATDEAGMQACFGPMPDPSSVVRLFTPVLTVPPQSEVIFCSSLDYEVTEDLVFTATSGGQMLGGHHVAVFVAASPLSDPTPHSCDGGDMLNLRFVSGAGGAAGGATQMADGLALRIAQGRQIVLQSHYINPTDEPLIVMDMVDLTLAEPGTTPSVVEAFTVVDSDFSVPAGEMGYSTVKECLIDEPMEIHMVLGHTHDFGVLFEFELIPGNGDPPSLLYRATDGPLLRSSPEVKHLAPSLQLEPGDKLRMTCMWDNTTDHALGWPEEMCVSLMYYTPARGFLMCDTNDVSPTPLGGEGDGCVAPGNLGNSMGVGRHCTPGGGECADNAPATICLGDFDARANYCSIIFCQDNSECGEAASCVQDSAGSACVPDICL